MVYFWLKIVWGFLFTFRHQKKHFQLWKSRFSSKSFIKLTARVDIPSFVLMISVSDGAMKAKEEETALTLTDKIYILHIKLERKISGNGIFSSNLFSVVLNCKSNHIGASS